MKLKTNLLKCCIGVSFLLISFSSLHAQMINEKYQSESIYLKGQKYVKNGVEHRIVSWNGDLRTEMEVSPDAVMEYSKFQRTRKTAFVLSAVGVVSIVASVFVDNNTDLPGYLLLGGVGLTIVSIPIYRTANSHLQKAIWLRNGAVLN